LAFFQNTFEAHNVLLPVLYSQPDGDASSGPLPLIFFLHGSGERGGDLERIRGYGIPLAAARRKPFPFITVSPLCPPRTYWEDLDSVLLALLDHTCTILPVDTRRVYLTGLSMGGHGVWVLGMARPERFAALAPVCPPFPNLPGVMERLPVLVDTPVWVFHGAKDDKVAPEHSQRMVDALRRLGGNVRYTVYPNVRHDSWVRAYAGPALYDWFLKQSL
jgi:predicted peptidase